MDLKSGNLSIEKKKRDNPIGLSRLHFDISRYFSIRQGYLTIAVPEHIFVKFG